MSSMRSDAAISQPMKPEPITQTSAPGCEPVAELAQIIQRAQYADARIVGSRYRQPRGLGAGGQQALPVAQLTSARESHSPSVWIEAHRSPADQIDLLVGEPRLVLQRQLVLARSPAAGAPSSAAAADRERDAHR